MSESLNNHVDIFILTASFGSGHNSTMKALIEIFSSNHSDLKVEYGDIFDITTPYMKEYFVETYDTLTKKNVSIYNKLYNIRDMKKNIIDDIMIKLFINKFDEVIKQKKPKVIVSVFPTSAQFASYYKGEYNSNIKTVTVITDVVSSWEWIAPNTDLYLVPSQEVKESLIKKQVDDANILVTGIPVRNQFLIDDDSFAFHNQVLIMGSAMGKVDIDRSVIDEMGKSNHNFVIITGKDKELEEKLKDYKLPDNLKVIGYTTDIAEYMKNSDLLVTKPGGATVFEAISVGLPMLIPPTTVGQENSNVDFIVKYQFGMTFSGTGDMLGKIMLCMNNPELLSNIRKNMFKFNENTEIDEAIKTIYKMCQFLPSENV